MIKCHKLYLDLKPPKLAQNGMTQSAEKNKRATTDVKNMNQFGNDDEMCEEEHSANGGCENGEVQRHTLTSYISDEYGESAGKMAEQDTLAALAGKNKRDKEVDASRSSGKTQKSRSANGSCR